MVFYIKITSLTRLYQFTALSSLRDFFVCQRITLTGFKQWAVSYESWAVLPKAQGSKLIAKKTAPLGATDNRQVVECEARNPCIHVHNDIKSAVGTTEKSSVVPTALWFCIINFYRHSALCAPYLPIVCRHYVTFELKTESWKFATSREPWVMSSFAQCSQLIARSLLR